MAVALDTLAYARRLREVGFSEQQAEGQAQALAAAMTDSLATKQDLRELDVRLDSRFAQIEARFAQIEARFAQIDARIENLENRLIEQGARFDARLGELEKRLEIRLHEQEKRLEIRLDEQEKRVELRFSEQTARFETGLADLERRVTFRLGGIMVAGIGVFSAVVKLL